MSISVGRQFLCIKSPFTQILRYRRKPNIRKPAIPHWKRAVVLKLTEPIYKDPNEDVHPADTCDKKIKALQKLQEEINPFEQILAKEFLEKIDCAKLVAVFHQLPMTMADLFEARVQLNKINLEYLKHNNNIMKLAFTGTKYEALLKLYVSSTVTFVGDQPAVSKLLKLERKIPGLVLIGGIVENRFMSVAELKRYAALPPLQSVQAQLVATLGEPLQHLSHNLIHNQTKIRGYN
nr:39S ribosomal protein L10, mitochondrial-like isoform X2 [Procambarus clarkii]